ncbi:MAG: hypothetical protein Q9223_002479 [Gallowayella weberi]
MPVFTRRQHMMADTPRTSTEVSPQEPYWVVQEGFERPQKELDFPSANLTGKMPRHNLRINTYSRSDLHDRYMSSEEEPSPSPDSSDAESTASEELKHKSSARVLAPSEEAPLDLSTVESESMTQIAVAMPIVAYGRPKLIDITNIAPMQRRKRAIKQPIAPSATMAKQNLARTISTPRLTENIPFIANEAAEMIIPSEKAAIVAQKQAAMAAHQRLKEEKLRTLSRAVSTAPSTWLPEEDEEEEEKEEEEEQEEELNPTNKFDGDDREYHVPSDTEADTEYGPYNLEPIQPSPQRPAHFPSPSRKRTNSNPFTIVTPTTLGKGLTKTWSITKKKVHHGSSSPSSSSTSGASLRPMYSHHAYQPMERQITKKPKMIARGANEREESLILPPFWEATAA